MAAQNLVIPNPSLNSARQLSCSANIDQNGVRVRTTKFMEKGTRYGMRLNKVIRGFFMQLTELCFELAPWKTELVAQNSVQTIRTQNPAFEQYLTWA